MFHYKHYLVGNLVWFHCPRSPLFCLFDKVFFHVVKFWLSIPDTNVFTEIANNAQGCWEISSHKQPEPGPGELVHQDGATSSHLLALPLVDVRMQGLSCSHLTIHEHQLCGAVCLATVPVKWNNQISVEIVNRILISFYYKQLLQILYADSVNTKI